MLLVAGSPLMVVITSSGRNPAVAAGPPGDTAWTNSPSGTPAWAAAAGGIGVVCTPKKAWVTRPVAMISSAMDLARSTGMAKPSPMLPPPDSPEGLGTVAPAVGTPTSLPAQSTLPSDRITSPDPVPLPLGPCAAIVTTEGTTSFATGVTAQ